MPSITNSSFQVVDAADTGASQINGLIATASTDTKLVCIGAIEGGEAWNVTSPCTFLGSDLTEISGSDTASTGNNKDVRLIAYEIDDPGEVAAEDGDTILNWQFGASPALAIWLAIDDCSAINVVDTTVNTSAGTTTVLDSGGSSGSVFLAVNVAQGSDMNPSSVNNSYAEITDGEGETDATTSDFAYNVSLLTTGTPAGVTCTWNTSDENTGLLLELVPDSMTAEETLTGFEITVGLGTIATDIPSPAVMISGFEISVGLGAIGTSTGQVGTAGDFGILIEGTTDKLLQENNDIILLEASQQPVPPIVIPLTGFLRPIITSVTEGGGAKTTITRTVRLISDVSNLITVQNGDNLDVIYNIVDETGAAVDITGGSIAWTVYESGTATSVISKTSPSGGVVLTTPASGVATVTIDPADTTSLRGTYIIDGEYTASGGSVYTFEDGGFKVK